jgi:hypothetical protein
MVLSHPPVLIHVLKHTDLVVLLERDIPIVGALVLVQSTSVGDDGFRVGLPGWQARRRRVVVGRRGGRLGVDVEIGKGLGRSGRSCVRLDGGGVGGCCSAKRTREGRFLWEGGVDIVVDSLVNHSFLEKAFEFLQDKKSQTETLIVSM